MRATPKTASPPVICTLIRLIFALLCSLLPRRKPEERSCTASRSVKSLWLMLRIPPPALWRYESTIRWRNQLASKSGRRPGQINPSMKVSCESGHLRAAQDYRSMVESVLRKKTFYPIATVSLHTSRVQAWHL